MGGNSSSTMEDFLTNNTNISQITNEAISNAASSKSSSVTINNAQIIIGGSGCCSSAQETPQMYKICLDYLAQNPPSCGKKGANISSNTSSTVTVINETSQTISSQISQKMQEEIQNQLQKASEQHSSNGYVPAIAGNNQSATSVNVVTNNISASVNSNISASQISSIMSNTFTEGSSSILMCGQADSCTINADVVSTILVQNISKQIYSAISSNEMAANVYNNITEQNKQTQTNIISEFLGGWKLIVLVMIIGAVMIGGLFLYMEMEKSSPKDEESSDS